MKIRPLHDRILVTRVAEQEVGRGGLIIPDTAKEKPQEGKVVAVGNGKVAEDGKRLALGVQAGNEVRIGMRVRDGSTPDRDGSYVGRVSCCSPHARPARR